MEDKWFGQTCQHQICQFEEDGDGVKDKSEPVLIYCNDELNSMDCEGNCSIKLCPYALKDRSRKL